MMHALLQRLRKAGAPAPEAPGNGTTVVREERGGGAGAVLFQPYQVSEFRAGEARAAGTPAAAKPADAPKPTDAPEPVDVPEPTHVPEPPAPVRAPNPIADEWRRQSPEVFRSVAARYCSRAPRLAEELRTLCLSGQADKLARLAESLKPTLSLFDMTAADAADRLKQAVAEESADIAFNVVALEHEVWRVMAAWQATSSHTAETPPEVAP